MSNGDACALILGYTWNGADCDVVHCGCDGTECDQLATTFGECRRAHASCIPDLCAPMDAVDASLGCFGLPLGWSWNGERCIQIGCGCSGTDCGALYSSVGDCTETHAECAGGIFDGCTQPSDCTLTSVGCCAPCVVVALTDYVALTDESVASYREGVCSEPQNSCLLPCIPEPTPSTFYATCDAGRCAPIDVAEWAQCTGDVDCQARSRDCCETCTAPDDLSDLVAVSDPIGYASLVCGPEASCDPCAPNYGRARARCIEGYCALEWVDTL